MSLIFVSNYFNHHQKALSDAFYERCEGDFRFLSTGEMREERRLLGYSKTEDERYVFDLGYDIEGWAQLVCDADVVIAGSSPEWLLKKRIRSKKLTFRYSERPLKNGVEPAKYLPRLVKWNFKSFWVEKCH